MEANARALATTAIAPVAWGSTYFVTRHYLPSGIPLTGAAIRALPAGLLLLALRPALPRGSWWWRTAVISLLTVGGFFVLIYVAGSRLPSSVAATLMACSAVATMLFAWPLLGERPRRRPVLGAVLGLAGVVALVGTSAVGLDAVGLAASLLAMLSSSLGFVLTKRWRPPVPPLTFAGWQLTFGGLVIAAVALPVEGTPPAMGVQELLGFAYLVLVSTALAYVAWFAGLRRLDATSVGLVGLLNPLAGAVLGLVAGGESFTPVQAAGAAAVLAGVLVGVLAGGSGRRGGAEARRLRGRACRVAVSAPGAAVAPGQQADPVRRW